MQNGLHHGAGLGPQQELGGRGLMGGAATCSEGFVLKGGWGGCCTGNRKKLSRSQAQLGQATCLAVS